MVITAGEDRTEVRGDLRHDYGQVHIWVSCWDDANSAEGEARREVKEAA